MNDDRVELCSPPWRCVEIKVGNGHSVLTLIPEEMGDGALNALLSIFDKTPWNAVGIQALRDLIAQWRDENKSLAAIEMPRGFHTAPVFTATDPEASTKTLEGSHADPPAPHGMTSAELGFGERKDAPPLRPPGPWQIQFSPFDELVGHECEAYFEDTTIPMKGKIVGLDVKARFVAIRCDDGRLRCVWDPTCLLIHEPRPSERGEGGDAGTPGGPKVD